MPSVNGTCAFPLVRRDESGANDSYCANWVAGFIYDRFPPFSILHLWRWPLKFKAVPVSRTLLSWSPGARHSYFVLSRPPNPGDEKIRAPIHQLRIHLTRTHTYSWIPKSGQQREFQQLHSLLSLSQSFLLFWRLDAEEKLIRRGFREKCPEPGNVQLQSFWIATRSVGQLVLQVGEHQHTYLIHTFQIWLVYFQKSYTFHYRTCSSDLNSISWHFKFQCFGKFLFDAFDSRWF